MKRSILLTIIFLLSFKLTAEEPVMKVHLQDGSERVYEISGIDSLSITKRYLNKITFHFNYHFACFYPTTEITEIKFERNDDDDLIISFNLSGLRNFCEFKYIERMVINESECEIDGFKFNYLTTSLNLVSRGLEELPNCIGSLVYLENLNLSNNKLSKLRESIGNLSNLFKLDISSNQISSLPESIKMIKKLRELHLENNNFSDEEKQKIISWLPNTQIYW